MVWMAAHEEMTGNNDAAEEGVPRVNPIFTETANLKESSQKYSEIRVN